VASRGDVAKAGGKGAGDDDQHTVVVGEEAPLPGLFVHHLLRSSMLPSCEHRREFGFITISGRP
jgi:hypothetical protein